MMKFNQKIYLIPAAKYEKLTNEVKTTSETSLSSENFLPKSESTSSAFTIQTEKKSEENIKGNEKSESPDISVPTAPISETPKLTEYSQTISPFNEPKNKESKLEISEKKHHTKTKRTLKFPPPGLPNLSHLSDTEQPSIKKQKQFKQVSPNKANTWMTLK